MRFWTTDWSYNDFFNSDPSPLPGHPEAMKMDPSPRADVGPDWCHTHSQREPVQQCDAGASGTPNCCLTSTNTRLFREEAPPGDEEGARHATEGKGDRCGKDHRAMRRARRAQGFGHCVREDP